MCVLANDGGVFEIFLDPLDRFGPTGLEHYVLEPFLDTLKIN